MANTQSIQILEDGYRNVVVKVVGSIDTSNVSTSTLVDPVGLSAMSNDGTLPTALRIDNIEYTITDGISVNIGFAGAVSTIAATLTGRGNVSAWSYGGIQNDATTPTGAITINTNGFVSSNIYNYTIVLKLVKQIYSAPVVQPLRTVAVENRIMNAQYNGTVTNYLFRWAHVIGSGDVSGFQLGAFGWFDQSSSGYTNLPNSYTIASMSVERQGTAVSVPVTYAGSRSKVINPGDTEIFSDYIKPVAFGLSKFRRGDVIWLKGILTVPVAGNFINVTIARNTGDRSGQQSSFYDPAVTTVSTTDATGVFTSTGTAPTATSFGWVPIIIGRYVSGDPKTFYGCGDSITQGTGDTGGALTPCGRGWLQRLAVDADLVSNPISIMNSGADSNSASRMVGNTKSLALAKYAKYAFESLGTNDLGTSGGGNVTTMHAQMVSIWSSLRAQGIQKIIRNHLLPRTTDSTNTATATDWGLGQKVQQLHNLFVTDLNVGLIDYFADATTVKNSTDENNAQYYFWLNTAQEADGTHPSAVGHANVALAYQLYKNALQ